MRSQQIQVLMVCLGNICRSPTAEAVFRHQVFQAGLAREITVDSAGTSDWHVGQPPDYRSVEHAARRGYDLSTQRCRKVSPRDFLQFDYILAMDQQNLRDLETRMPAQSLAKVQLFLGEQGVAGYGEVPDPYSGGEAGFELVLDLIEAASASLLEQLVRKYGLQPAIHLHD